MATPLARDVGTLALSDATALGLWTVTLTAIVYYAREASLGALVAAAVAAALLELARPAGWLPLGAAAGYAVAAHRCGGRGRRRAAAVMLLAQGAVVLAVLAWDAAQHGPSLSAHLRWQYQWQQAVAPHPGESFGAWYWHGVAGALGVEFASIVERGLPLFALVSAAVGLVLRRDDAAAAPLFGAACAAPLAFWLNPADVARALELPLIPVVAFGVVACVAAALEAARATLPREGAAL